MRFRLFITVALAVFLAGSSAEAQMMFKPKTDYLSISGKKKKDTKSARSKEKKQKISYTTEIRAGLGFFTGFPLGDFNRDTYTGYGFDAGGEYFLDPQISVGLATGYHSFKYDEIHIGKGHYTMIPVLANGSYYFKEGDFHPFAGLNAGVFLAHSKYDSIIEPTSYVDPITQLFVHTPGGVKSIDKKETAFGIAPMAGIVYKATDLVWLNCNLNYTLIFTEKKNTSLIGFHIGLTYSFGI